MTPKEEKKYSKALKDAISDYQESDSIIISQIIDYIKMNEYAKHQLAIEAESSGKLDWVCVTTIATCTKNVNLLMRSLGITPNDRQKMKLLSGSTDNGLNNLKNFLNES